MIRLVGLLILLTLAPTLFDGDPESIGETSSCQTITNLLCSSDRTRQQT